MKSSALRLGRYFVFPQTGAAAAGGALLLLTLLGSGCTSQPVAGTSAVSPRHAAAGGDATSSGLVETSAIQRSPSYRQAILSFSGKDYRGALGRIKSLLKTPHLSPDALAFLNRQRLLCQDAMAGRKSGGARSATASAAAQAGTRPKRSALDGDTQLRTRADCGPRALLLVCQELKVPANLDGLRKAAGTTADGSSLAGMEKAAQSVGLTADGVQMDQNALLNLSHPAIAWVDGNHYIAVISVHHSLMDPSVNGDAATVHDPNHKGEEEMPLAGPTGLLARSGGMMLVLSQDSKLATSVH